MLPSAIFRSIGRDVLHRNLACHRRLLSVSVPRFEENNENKTKVKLGISANTIAKKTERKRIKNANLIKKFKDGIDKKQRTKTYTVYESMSLKDLADVTSKPLDILLDLALSYVSRNQRHNSC